MLVWAPGLAQARLPATTPRFIASANDSPRSRAAAKAPTNVSPAAVVSTTATFGAAANARSPPAKPTAPAGPSVTMTAKPKRRASSAPIASGSLAST